METCCICEKETFDISFIFGYGSSFDGEGVCWGCASELDSAVIAAKKLMQLIKDGRTVAASSSQSAAFSN